jgi:preprotein translocase subunit YajC
MSLIKLAQAAQTATVTAPNSKFNVMQFLPMVIIFVLFWFLLIRPQQKKAILQNQMLSSLQSGDEVMTSGGILAKINKIADNLAVLEIANNVLITVQKSTITSKLEKGTLDKVNK